MKTTGLRKIDVLGEQVLDGGEVLRLGGGAEGIASLIARVQPTPVRIASPPARPVSTWAPSGRPSSSWTAREASISFARSTPVSTPISSSIETRSSVEMLPVEPGGTGQPPSSPNADSNDSTPCSSAASTLARPWPRVLWKWAVSSTAAEALARGGEELADLARVRHPGRVAEGDLLAAGGGEPLGDLEHALGRHLALVGAAEAGRDHALAAQALVARALDHALEPGERLVDRAVDVLAVVGLRGGEEEVDLVEAVALGERPLEPALVRDQDRVGDAVAALDRRPAPPRRRRAAGSRRGARTRSPRCRRRPGRAEHPDQPHLLRASGSPRARSGTRRAARPRGSARSRGSSLIAPRG